MLKKFIVNQNILKDFTIENSANKYFDNNQFQITKEDGKTQ